ncbi:hypothetical protein MNBD_GAMMA20-1539 [hydrothermal vent metagenome]|uniref:Uncharacterized protein n=1 Tax=hydrothermal vent metagenome TaxID=652676 RepID=A0A3B1AAD8_9ZZZZ
MRRLKILFVTIFSLSVLPAFAANDTEALSQIAENLKQVCDKPENAGNYWDIRAKGNGGAEIKLKLADIGMTGEATFSKAEWHDIQKTVEDNNDYRNCVKALSPIFIEKFSGLVSEKFTVKKPKKRTLGGIKWQESGGGLKVTLSSCHRQFSSVICEFSADPTDSDLSIDLSENSAIYDQSGNKFVPSEITVANLKTAFRDHYFNETVHAELVRGIDITVKLKFNNVSKEFTTISKAILIATIKQKRASKENHIFTFRDINIVLD